MNTVPECWQGRLSWGAPWRRVGFSRCDFLEELTDACAPRGPEGLAWDRTVELGGLAVGVSPFLRTSCAPFHSCLL